MSQYKILRVIGIISLILFTITPVLNARYEIGTSIKSGDCISQSVEPDMQVRLHKVGNTRLIVTNYGCYGVYRSDSYVDPEIGEVELSCEHPPGSQIENIFLAGLWIGGVVDGDTLVSVGVDGWENVFEMYADSLPEGDIEERSNNPADPYYHPDAVGELEYTAVYYDTLTDPNYVNPSDFDNRPHIPLGLKITESSYSWSNPEFEDFILFRYKIKNINSAYIEDMVLGLFFDCDILQVDMYPSGFDDDIAGHYSRFDPNSGKYVQMAWIADNDGDPNGNTWDDGSVRSALAISILDFPFMQDYAFNWYVSHAYQPGIFDWGPMQAENYRDFGTGGLGTPSGDRNKYYMMRNNEIDYDQIYSAVDYSGEGWLPPPVDPLLSDLPNGYDTKFLLSCGSLDLAPGDSVIFGFVLTVGDNFHQEPENFANLFDPDNPDAFYNTLDFSDLVSDVVAAQNLYDSIFLSDYLCGDANYDGAIQIGDAVYIVNYVFLGGLPPYPFMSGDANCDDKVNISDVIYLINYLFRNGFLPGDPDGDGIPDC